MTVIEESIGMYIDGAMVPGSSGRSFETYDPSTNEVIAQVALAEAEDVSRAVTAARTAFDAGPWPGLRASQREAILRAIVDGIRSHEEELAALETRNNGMPLADALRDVRNMARAFEYYAGSVGKLTGETYPLGGPFLDYSVREPVGVVASIVPWNSPLILLSRSVAPALAAGCTVVAKPAEQTPLTTLRVAEICREAGLSPGVLNVITGPGFPTGQALVAHPGVDKVAFTGSSATGSQIMSLAAHDVKRISLELGGKSPGIVFGDADIELAAREAVAGVFGNCGQRCNARTRILVQRDVHEAFVDAFLEGTQRLKVGLPTEPETDLGPLISPQHLQRVRRYVDLGIQEGARLCYDGGAIMEPELARGNFMKPVIFDDVRNDMTIAREEIFGPVACLLPFDSENEAVEVANDSPYGLSATIWTRDVDRAHDVARRLRIGSVGINTSMLFPIEAPYGGYKTSGLGRDWGMEALRNYTEVKNVIVEVRR